MSQWNAAQYYRAAGPKAEYAYKPPNDLLKSWFWCRKSGVGLRFCISNRIPRDPKQEKTMIGVRSRLQGQLERSRRPRPWTPAKEFGLGPRLFPEGIRSHGGVLNQRITELGLYLRKITLATTVKRSELEVNGRMWQWCSGPGNRRCGLN